MLNPATLLFIGFVLSWPFALLRLALGVALICTVVWYANRLDESNPLSHTEPRPAPIEDPHSSIQDVSAAWLRALWREVYTILSGYILIVLLLGAARAWLFAPTLTIANSGALGIVALALAGTLFVIPTAGEVPIIQTLVGLGMGIAPAAALLLTLPAISLPSVFIV